MAERATIARPYAKAAFAVAREQSTLDRWSRWLGTARGAYVGHGETYLHPQDILWWSKGGVLHGESPRRIQWLKDFLAQPIMPTPDYSALAARQRARLDAARARRAPGPVAKGSAH